jgi:hypothetical protein
VIDVAWPLQQRGIVPQNTAAIVQAFQTHLASFEPVTESQKTLHAEAYREFDRLVELRRIRLKSVVAGLPAPLHAVFCGWRIEAPKSAQSKNRFTPSGAAASSSRWQKTTAVLDSLKCN